MLKSDSFSWLIQNRYLLKKRAATCALNMRTAGNLHAGDSVNKKEIIWVITRFQVVSG